MGFRTTAALTGAVLLALPGLAEAQASSGSNPVIELHKRGQPVFGLYAPRAPGGRGRGAAPAEARSPMDLARETLTYGSSDYIFNGSMEGRFDASFAPFVEYVSALTQAGASVRTNPIIVKAPRIAEDPDLVSEQIGRQLNAGVSGIMFVGVESAEEVRTGLAAMRFRSKGGTRSDDVGSAPVYWGMTADEYRQKADLWPLNPEGELINWTIVESHEGLANVREIAAVEGIGVLWPGAGTLRGLFSSTSADGQRVLDEEAWEASIQTVLAACKEFEVACGFPANENDIEMRMEQGFSVFVMNWGERGFATIDIGRKAAGR